MRPGWKVLIWGLNLGNGTRENAIQEAKLPAAAAKGNLLGFEIGNEPDLFTVEGHRHTGYDYDAYLREYRASRSRCGRRSPASFC